MELAVTSGRHRVVVGVLRPGDIPLLLGLPLPYTARAVDAVTCEPRGWFIHAFAVTTKNAEAIPATVTGTPVSTWIRPVG